MQLTAPERQFLSWLKAYDRPLYQVMATAMNETADRSELGQADAPAPEKPGFFSKFASGFSSALDSISNSLQKALPAYTDYRANRELVKINLKRAATGQPPIPQTPAAPPINVAPVTPAQQPQVQYVANQAAELSLRMGQLKWLVPLAAGGILLWAVTTKKKGR